MFCLILCYNDFAWKSSQYSDHFCTQKGVFCVDNQSKKKRVSDLTLWPIAERIRHIRKDLLNMSQEKFAEEMGVGRSAVSDWEGQYTPIDARNLMKLCELSGCDADYILGRIDEKTHDIKHTKQVTGLSESAIEYIISWKDAQNCSCKWASYLSQMIESHEFVDMMNHLSSFVNADIAMERALELGDRQLFEKLAESQTANL